MKTALGELDIFGPGGNPGAKPAPKKYTEVPWEDVKREEEEAAIKAEEKEMHEPRFMKKQYSLADKNAGASELTPVYLALSTHTDMFVLISGRCRGVRRNRAALPFRFAWRLQRRRFNCGILSHAFAE